MDNDKTTLLVIALVAIVAIVAAFGIVNMTGMAVARNGQVDSIEAIEIIEERNGLECMQESMLIWAARQEGCLRIIDVLERDGCLKQAKLELEYMFIGCMDGNGGALDCSDDFLCSLVSTTPAECIRCQVPSDIIIAGLCNDGDCWDCNGDGICG